MDYLANEMGVVKELDAMTSLQRSAFPLLLADYALACVEPLDQERSRRMSPALAIDYLYLPRIEPVLERWWRKLLGAPALPASDAPSLSVTGLVPDGSLAQRFAELHMAPASDGDDLTRLAMSAREPYVSSAILVVEIAGELALSSPTGRRIVSGIDFALFELYEQVSTKDMVDASVATCLAIGADIDGTLETARAARSRARAAGPILAKPAG